MRRHHRSIILVSCVLIGLAGPRPTQAFFHEVVKKALEDADNAISGWIDPEPEASPSEDPSKTGTVDWNEPVAPGAATSQSSYNHDKQMVADAQRMLNQLGYNAGVVDGHYGKKTRVAIRTFHQDRGLPAGEDVTPQLVAQLSTETQGQDIAQKALADAAPSPQQQPQIQSADSPRFDKPLVTEIQTLLTSLGYKPGPTDGAFGNKSQKAITAFQQQRGDPVTGLPTPSVMQALRSESHAAALSTAASSSVSPIYVAEDLKPLASAASPAAVHKGPNIVALSPYQAVNYTAQDKGWMHELFGQCARMESAYGFGNNAVNTCNCVVNIGGDEVRRNQNIEIIQPVYMKFREICRGTSAASPAAAPASPAPKPAATSGTDH